MSYRRFLGAICVALAMFAVSASFVARAADHGDAPLVRFNQRLDLNDTYLFVSPSNPANVVLIMTMSPAARVLSPNNFEPNADYDFLVTTNAGVEEDFEFNIRFGPPGPDNVQGFRLEGKSRTARLFRVAGATGQTIALPGGGVFRANEIDDPFFFDLIAFRTGLGSLCGGAASSTGVNFFRGLNVTAIALELPRALFGSDRIGMWARTIDANGRQIDREGRPAINTVFLPAALKDPFNFAHPRDDRALFREPVIATAMALGNTAARAAALADFFLPDILTIDLSNNAGFPNGRRLQDDVIDTALSVVSDGGISRGDCVANDSTFTTVFPYWAGPNK